ncbi:MAG TPA: protein kinase [Rhizobiaceae bacterium]|nr:protein kinase [Rhizobiaceae bacterium]
MTPDDKTRIFPPIGHATVGTQLSGIYELDERIASGGMGEVYRGHNIQTGDLVAIKIVLPEFARDQTILSLFRKEASILNGLSHDAIVRYHVFTIDPGIGRPYLAMEFVNGDSLFDVMGRGPMAAADVRRLGHRLASGLNAAHQAGTVHRDLSPDNIILPGGRVDRAKIIDFGIARSAAAGGETLIGGNFAGKYNYVSPEQLGLYGGEVSERSDMYSLGLVLAAALRGKPLEMSGSQFETLEKRRAVPDLSDLDPDLRLIIESMLQPQPDARPTSMAEIAEAMKDADATINPVSAPGDRLSVPPRGTVQPAGSPVPHPVQTSGEVRFVPHVRPAHLSQPHPKPPPSPVSRTAPPARSGKTRNVAIAGLVGTIVLGGAVAYLGFVSRREPVTATTEASQLTPAVSTPTPTAVDLPEERETNKGSRAEVKATASEPSVPNRRPEAAAGDAAKPGAMQPRAAKAQEAKPAASSPATALREGDGAAVAKPSKPVDSSKADTAAAASPKPAPKSAQLPAKRDSQQGALASAVEAPARLDATPQSGTRTALPPAQAPVPPKTMEHGVENRTEAATTDETRLPDTRSFAAPGEKATDREAVLAAPRQGSEDPPPKNPSPATDRHMGQGEQKVAIYVPEAPKPAEEPQAAIDDVAERISWLRDYGDGGECFYAAATSATDKAMEIEGFGTDVEPFARMLDAFQAKFHIEPDIHVRLIEQAQCDVPRFLRALGTGASERPELVLDRTSVPNGSPVSGSLRTRGGLRSSLLLIDHRGMVFNLDDRVTVEAGRAFFNIPIGLGPADLASGKGIPQIIIAVTGATDLQTASLVKPMPAAVALPQMLSEIRQKGSDFSATAKYFRLGG